MSIPLKIGMLKICRKVEACHLPTSREHKTINLELLPMSKRLVVNVWASVGLPPQKIGR